MKHFYFFLLFSAYGFGQNITFNDPDLLTYLTTRLCVDVDGNGIFEANADFNSDGQIQLSEAQQVLRFKFSTLAHNITDISGFENFSNLQFLEVTTINIDHLDLSVWPSLEVLKLSSSIDSFTFDNPLLTDFHLQNVAFSNPLFDLTNLPNLEYVRIQSYGLTDNLIFGTHNNLEELRILAGTYSSLNLSGMPALRYLTIGDFVGSSLDISSCTSLEEFIFRYSDNVSTITGIEASSALEKIDFIQDNYSNSPSNLNLSFTNQSLNEIKLYGANSVSISNNSTIIGRVQLYFINGFIDVNQSNFGYINTTLSASLRISFLNGNQLNLSDIEGLRFLHITDLDTTIPLDLSTIETENISFYSSNLAELNLKNGDILQSFASDYESNIQFICVDSDELAIVENGNQNTDAPSVVHPYCTFVLGGDYYEITGDVSVDLGSGCTDSNGPIFDVQFTVSDGSSTDIFYPSSTNDYSYTLPEGTHVLNSQLINLDLWTVSPSSIELNFPSDGSPYNQDYCITPGGVFDDLEIVVIPLNAGQPGFQANYKIIYKNKGTTTLSGNLDFSFNDDVMNFSSASPNINSQTTGILTWDYTGLLPFETREINLSMVLNTPLDPTFPLNAEDVVVYTATINPVATDLTPNNNSFILNQTLVNSLDPNDITCLEGIAITPDYVGEYVHYLVRFENTGTSNAVNVVVKDILDTAKYDISSLVPLHASHNFYTRIENANQVEFIFENIQLPFDDASNDGYVLFKIKTLPTLVVGNSFSNSANIYFDYNFPIVTNDAVTVVSDNLGIEEFISTDIKLYPNPAGDYFQIATAGQSISHLTIMDMMGKQLKRFEASDRYDISNFTSGIYFVMVHANTGTRNMKLVKR